MTTPKRWQAGLKILADAGAAFFIHCGDIGGPACIDLLAGLASAFVFGNCDFDRAALARYAQQLEVPCYGNYADLTLDGKRVAVMHGDDPKLKHRVLVVQEHDYLFQGHTHLRADAARRSDAADQSRGAASSGSENRRDLGYGQ